MKKHLLVSAASIALISLLAVPAFAQSVPSTVDAGRVQSDLKRNLRSRIKVDAPQVTSAPTVQAPKGAEKINFTLKNVVLEGADTIPQEKLAYLYEDYIGQDISLATVYEIANSITLRYRDKGYLLSRAIVPQQEIDGGTVKIRVVEGFIDGYSIQGDARGGLAQIEDYAERLINSGTLTAQKLERYLLLMNDLPGVSARGVLAPSPTTAGGADLNIIVEQDRFEGFASVDNFGNSFLGELRGTAGIQINSLFEATDQLNGTVLVAPDQGELFFFSLGYEQSIFNNGTTAGFNVSHTLTSPSLPPSLGGALDSEGESTTVNFNLDHPFIRSRSLNVVGNLDFDLSTNKTNFGPGLGALETEDTLRVLRAGSTVSYLDGFSGYNFANISVSKGLEIFGSSQGGETGLSRALGEPDFIKINLDASRLQRLYGPINGLIAVSGQWTDDPLLASEEFGLGGTEFARGYDSSEITGDQAFAAKVELSYNNVVEQPYINDYQVYTFYDVGTVFNEDPGAGLDPRDSLASVGVGTRMTFKDGINGDIFLAKPLINGSTSRGDEEDDIRLKFSLNANF